MSDDRPLPLNFFTHAQWTGVRNLPEVGGNVSIAGVASRAHRCISLEVKTSHFTATRCAGGGGGGGGESLLCNQLHHWSKNSQEFLETSVPI